MPITASAPARSAWTSMVSKACWRVRSASSVNSEMLPPNSVCRPAPMVPNTERDRTTTPRTTPRFSTTRWPATSKPVVVMLYGMSATCAWMMDVLMVVPYGLGNRRALAVSQRHSRKRPAHARAVVVHVPLPRIARAAVDERRVKAVGRAVVEQKGNGIAVHSPMAGARRVERGGRRIVHPHAGVFTGPGIATEEHDRLVRRRAVGRALARHLVHLHVFAPEHPIERDVVRRLRAGDGARQHPVSDETIEERVRGERLRGEAVRREEQCA